MQCKLINIDTKKDSNFIHSNLEKGYVAHVDPVNSSAHQTLVRQMNWLDRNMETLLQQPPAPTVRFVSNNRTQDEHPAKQFIDATSKPIDSSSSLSEPVIKSEASSSKPVIKNEPTSSKLVIKPETSLSKPVVNYQTIKREPSHKFTSVEISTAEKRHKHELGQLQTRFCDSISTR